LKEFPNLLGVGLTGGIGCGKSTVGRLLEERGCHRLDADRIGHEVMEPGRPAHAEIVERFGEQILAPDGTIDRARVAGRVFSDPVEREALESILHPRIIEEERKRLRDLSGRVEAAIAVVEAALMVEAGTWRLYDRLVVVHAPLEARVTRMATRGLDHQRTRARIQAQTPLEEKVALADYPVDNGGILEGLGEQVSDLHSMLCEDLEAKMEGRPLPQR